MILTVLCVSLSLSAMRGIRVTGRAGKELRVYTDYHALVVGVGDYTAGWPDLPGALKDCEEVSRALSSYGFEVKTVTNPTSRELERALRAFAYETGSEPDRALLLYFAGHGETMTLADGTELGFIIPSDCPLKEKDPLGFDDLAISMKDMEAHLKRLEAEKRETERSVADLEARQSRAQKVASLPEGVSRPSANKPADSGLELAIFPVLGEGHHATFFKSRIINSIEEQVEKIGAFQEVQSKDAGGKTSGGYAVGVEKILRDYINDESKRK